MSSTSWSPTLQYPQRHGVRPQHQGVRLRSVLNAMESDSTTKFLLNSEHLPKIETNYKTGSVCLNWARFIKNNRPKFYKTFPPFRIRIHCTWFRNSDPTFFAIRIYNETVRKNSNTLVKLYCKNCSPFEREISKKYKP